MSVKEDFNELVRKYVEYKMGFPVVRAELSTYTSTYSGYGCETCGPDTESDFDVYYWIAGDSSSHHMNVDGDPLSWLANSLLPFEEDSIAGKWIS